MQAGIDHKVPYEVACGGNAICCTCHVYLAPETTQAKDYLSPKENELDALDSTCDVVNESRLACQTTVTESMDGTVMTFIGL